MIKFARPGCHLKILYSLNGTNESAEGTLVEIDADYLLVETVSEVFAIACSSVTGYKVSSTQPNTGSDDTVATHPEGTAVDQTQMEAPPHQPIEIAQRDLSSSQPHGASRPVAGTTRAALQAIVDYHLGKYFSNESPSPDFKIKDLLPDEQSTVVAAMNRYNYAMKVHERRRVLQDITPLSQLGEALNHSGLIFLAAQLAEIAGDESRAMNCYAAAGRFGEVAGWLRAAKIALGRDETTKAATLIRSYAERANVIISGDENEALYELLSGEPDGTGRPLVQQVPLPRGVPEQQARVAQEGGKADITPQPSILGTESARQGKSKIYGKIQRVWVPKGYGFISETGANRQYYFKMSSIEDESLRNALQNNMTSIRVEFERATTSTPAGMQKLEAINIVAKPRLEARGSGPSPRPRPARRTLGKNPSDVGKRAREAEAQNDFAAAESYYRQDIAQNGKTRLASIKALAWLLNRLDRWEEGISLLDQHRVDLSRDKRSVNYLRLNILLKGKAYAEATGIIAELLIGADAQQSLNLRKQAVYCYAALNDFKAANSTLDRLLSDFPGDKSITRMQEQVVALSQDGFESSAALYEEERLIELQSFGLGLSVFAIHCLESCQLIGADERVKALGSFAESDFRSVSNYLDRIRGRRPRERAEAALTLAYMCWREPYAAGDRRLNDLLRRYYRLMAEASAYVGNEIDVVKTYCGEALALGDSQAIIQDLPVLFSVYTGNVADASAGDDRLTAQAAFEKLRADQVGWNAFLHDLPYFLTKNPMIKSVLTREFSREAAAEIEALALAMVDDERHRQAAEVARLDQLRKVPAFSAAGLQELMTGIDHLIADTLFPTDANRMREFYRILGEVNKYLTELDYTERDSSYHRIFAALQRLNDAITDVPTFVAVNSLLPLISRFREALAAHYRKWQEQAVPVLSVENVLGTDRYSIEPNGTIAISLQLFLGPGSPSVEAIRIEIDGTNGVVLDAIETSSDVLRAATRREVRVNVKPSVEHLSDEVFTLNGRVHYSSRGSEGLPVDFSLPINIDSVLADAPIPNPYAAYSGGSVVMDPDMFFGRDALLSRISEQVTDGPIGQCFVLYGQKRSGKTSVLRQLSRSLSLPNLCVYVTLGELETDQASVNLLRLCTEQLLLAAEKCGLDIDHLWSGLDGDRPLHYFQKCVESVRLSLLAIGEQPRIVFLVDEFTYMFEYITEGIVDRSFMRQWKALLEGAIFSAVIVGQDSMPRFKHAFPNEFGVTHDERISYLSPESATALASEPISLSGDSRYRGRSMDKLLRVSGRSPWFLQICCDELVRHLNSRRARFVTEADINVVVQHLISGDGMLSIERFDPLITAAGDSVLLAPRETYLEILSQIASMSVDMEGAKYEDLAPSSDNWTGLIDDMVERQVLAREFNGRLKITVGLFEEWLRLNRPPGSQAPLRISEAK